MKIEKMVEGMKRMVEEIKSEETSQVELFTVQLTDGVIGIGVNSSLEPYVDINNFMTEEEMVSIHRIVTRIMGDIESKMDKMGGK